MGRYLAYFLGILAMTLGACTPESVTDEFGITRYTAPKTLEHTPLTSQDGTPISVVDLAGDYVLISIGYTHCPDVCPLNLANYKQIKKLLGEDESEVSFVFVSVDGNRDTPERLKQYIGMFDSEFIGLTGNTSAVDAFIKPYGGTYVINNYGGLRDNYTVDHTATLFLLNPEGKLVRGYSYGIDYTLIAEDLNSLLHPSTAPAS